MQFIAAKLASLDSAVARQLTKSDLQNLNEQSPPQDFADAWESPPVLLLGKRGDYGTVAEFEALSGLSTKELIHIGNARSDVTDFPTRGWKEHLPRIELASSLGYYPLDEEVFLKRAVRKAETLTKTDDPALAPVIKSAIAVAENPMIHSWTTTLPRERFRRIASAFEKGEAAYLFPRELKGLHELANFQPTLKEEGLFPAPQARRARALAAHWTSLQPAQLLSLGKRSRRSRLDVVSQKALKNIPISTLKVEKRRNVAVKYYRPIDIAQAIGDHAEAVNSKAVIPASKLTGPWFRAAARSFPAGAWQKIVKWHDYKTAKSRKDLDEPAPVFVDAELVREVRSGTGASRRSPRRNT
jgi:hypothetical protein